jgi:hypothetical protein
LTKAATAGEKRRPGTLTRRDGGSLNERVCRPGRMGENSGLDDDLRRMAGIANRVKSAAAYLQDRMSEFVRTV